MTRLLEGCRRDPCTERVPLALVANRALEPGSKLAAAGWVNRRARIDGLPETSDDACYRAMDWLHAAGEGFEKAVFDQVADLLNLEVDLLFFDTTSTYFETEADEAVHRDETGRPTDPGAQAPEAEAEVTGGFRAHGKSKDHRDDLPQIVIGMAVTRTGIPIRFRTSSIVASSNTRGLIAPPRIQWRK